MVGFLMEIRDYCIKISGVSLEERKKLAEVLKLLGETVFDESFIFTSIELSSSTTLIHSHSYWRGTLDVPKDKFLVSIDEFMESFYKLYKEV